MFALDNKNIMSWHLQHCLNTNACVVIAISGDPLPSHFPINSYFLKLFQHLLHCFDSRFYLNFEFQAKARTPFSALGAAIWAQTFPIIANAFQHFRPLFPFFYLFIFIRIYSNFQTIATNYRHSKHYLINPSFYGFFECNSNLIKKKWKYFRRKDRFTRISVSRLTVN